LTAAPAIGERYEDLRPLGHGAFGRVYKARDRALGSDVAVKVLSGAVSDSNEFLREIAVLRLLRLPGVVRQLDDGVSAEGAPYLVTELVDGSHFPGRGCARAWDGIVHTVTALLEAMHRVHEAGVIHRDLKPSNVLVDQNGVPTVLDFGLASAGPVPTDYLVGTPSYVSPEQAEGRSGTLRSDIYSLGVMIYEALTGRRPIEGATATEVLRRKVTQLPVSISAHRPEAPQWLVELVDAMVETMPRHRPSSIRDVLEAMEHPPATSTTFRLGPEVVTPIRDALLEGRSVRVLAGAGMGRTRLVEDVADAVSLSGAPVAIARTPDEAQAAEAKIVLLDPDDGMKLDLDRTGRVTLQFVEVGPADFALTAFEREDLAPMFHGPEAILHFPSDAARELHRRAGGGARATMQELSAWMRAGLCHWDGDRVRIARPALDSLRTTLPVLASGSAAPEESSIPSERFAGAEALDRVRKRVMFGDVSGAARDLLALARKALDSGHDGEALALGVEAHRMAYACADEEACRGSLDTVVAAALHRQSPQTFDVARWEVASTRFPSDRDASLVEILRLFEAISHGRQNLAAIATSTALPPFGDEQLDRFRALGFAEVLRMTRPGDLSRETVRRLGDAITEWLADDPDGERGKSFAGAVGRAMYGALDFEQAVAFHSYAATRRSASDRLSSLVHVAIAHMERYELERAEALALEAMELAARLRDAREELTTVLLVGNARYRSGRPTPLGDDVVEAARRTSDIAAGNIEISEAAVYWRLGDLRRARNLAESAQRSYRAAGHQSFDDLATALTAMLGASLTEADASAIATRCAEAAIPGIALQSLALLQMAGRSVNADVVRALASRLPESTWTFPREILSVRECVDACASSA
jgi:serine/threonine-protein kinase